MIICSSISKRLTRTQAHKKKQLLGHSFIHSFMSNPTKEVEAHPFLNVSVKPSELDELSQSLFANAEVLNKRSKKKTVLQRLKKKMSPKKSLVLMGNSDVLEMERSDSFYLSVGPLKEGESLDDKVVAFHNVESLAVLEAPTK
eukprot:m.61724 g.61724  ORF g.61724 m.61724 type:complete len:143 (-) comp8003_c0_seq1:343-771(-)